MIPDPVFLAIFAALGYLIGKSKGRQVAGVVWGILLGPIGLIVVACLREKPRHDD